MEWLVEWLKVIAPVIAVLALWWKIASTMATKTDISELRREQKDDMLEMKADLRKDIRELRELLFMHVSDHEKHGMHGPQD